MNRKTFKDFSESINLARENLKKFEEKNEYIQKKHYDREPNQKELKSKLR